MRQRLWNGWLNDQVGDLAKRTVGLNSLTVRVRVSNLNNAGKGEECTAEEAHGYPQRTTDSRIRAALQHPPIIYTQSQVTQFAAAFCHATRVQVRAARPPAWIPIVGVYLANIPATGIVSDAMTGSGAAGAF